MNSFKVVTFLSLAVKEKVLMLLKASNRKYSTIPERKVVQKPTVIILEGTDFFRVPVHEVISQTSLALEALNQDSKVKL